jgi:hypothetical protein
VSVIAVAGDSGFRILDAPKMKASTKRRLIWGVSIVLGAYVLLGVVGPLIPYKQVDNWVCPLTGSTKIQVTWFGCFSHDERTTSALEQWLKRREPAFEPQWKHTSTTTHYVFARGHECGETPEIYQLVSILDDVVGQFDDERIAGLVSVLRHGSRDEQRQAIKMIWDDYLAKRRQKREQQYPASPSDHQ